MSDQTQQIKAGTLRNLHDAWLWDVAEKQRTQRAAEAIGYGLNPYEFARPFPGTTSTVSVVQHSSGIGRLAWMIAGMAAMVGVGAGGALLGAWALGAIGGIGGAPRRQVMEPQEYEVIFESDGRGIAPVVIKPGDESGS